MRQLASAPASQIGKALHVDAAGKLVQTGDGHPFDIPLLVLPIGRGFCFFPNYLSVAGGAGDAGMVFFDGSRGGMSVLGTNSGFNEELVYILGDGNIHPSLRGKIDRPGSDLSGYALQHFQGAIRRTGQTAHGGRHFQPALIRAGDAYAPGVFINVAAHAQVHMDRCFPQDFPSLDHGQCHGDGFGTAQCHPGIGVKDLENAFVGEFHPFSVF